MLITLFSLQVQAQSNQTAKEKSNSMILLAVSENNNAYIGSAAQLDLEIKQGKGRVFLDTSPASKIDTQLSTRFAKEIACDFAQVDCSKYDFFYTIKADTTIIGGPSAGAAMAVLTIATLKDINIDKNTAMTGTINSGELIGPVGGLKEKIEAASNYRIKKVLIPVGISNTSVSRNSNVSFDLVKYGKELGMEVKEVDDLNQAIYEFSGITFRNNTYNFTVDGYYKSAMKNLAGILCKRNSALLKNASLISKWNPILEKETQRASTLVPRTKGSNELQAQNLTNKAILAYRNQDYYASASYCFGSNVIYKGIIFTMQNITREEISGKSKTLLTDLNKLKSEIKYSRIATMTDLQAYLVVNERIDEATRLLEDINKSSNPDLTNVRGEIALAEERYMSAKSWSIFFGKSSESLKIDGEQMKNFCNLKIAEAQQRIEYANFFIPNSLGETKLVVDNAIKSQKEGDYAFCIYQASLAKAQSNLVMSVIGSEDQHITLLAKRKLNAAGRVINEQIQKGSFPIVGYSYYEYSKNLLNESKYSALLYSEYSLELSDLNPYFARAESTEIKIELDKSELEESSNSLNALNITESTIIIFVSGIITGMMILGLSLYANKTLYETSVRKPRKGKKR